MFLLLCIFHFAKIGCVVFVCCDQHSKVTADYDSIRLEKNLGWMVCVCVDVCVCVCVYDLRSDGFSQSFQAAES